MKKMLTLLVMMITTLITAQTQIDLSNMTSDGTLGQNCSNSQDQEVFATFDDLNLNGYTLDLRNVNLIVNGNINGPGTIIGCGNPNTADNSKICRVGSINNSPTITNVTILNDCSTLNVPEFEFTNYGHNYKVYDITGRELLTGVTSDRTYSELPSNVILLLKVDGYAVKKIIKQ